MDKYGPVPATFLGRVPYETAFPVCCSAPYPKKLGVSHGISEAIRTSDTAATDCNCGCVILIGTRKEQIGIDVSAFGQVQPAG